MFLMESPDAPQNASGFSFVQRRSQKAWRKTERIFQKPSAFIRNAEKKIKIKKFSQKVAERGRKVGQKIKMGNTGNAWKKCGKALLFTWERMAKVLHFVNMGKEIYKP